MYEMNRGLPLITYAPMGSAGSTLLHTNAYKGEGGSQHDQNTHFVRSFIDNATISETLRIEICVGLQIPIES